jgi:pimeloyl-ACP methyl ester carboxylesterase
MRLGVFAMLDIKRFTELGGVAQKIHIVSKDAKHPVLLFLHGGPGVVNRNILQKHADLLDHFTCVGWDQRGSGGSFLGVRRKSLTVRQMTDDAAELVAWLCKKFRKDKIFIIGGSWGSELGTHLAYRYPAQLAAYVGFGQVCAGAKNEELSYAFALRCAREANDEKSIKKLQKVGPPVNGLYKYGILGMRVQREVMNQYGGYSPTKRAEGYLKGIAKPYFTSGEYTPYDILGILIGAVKLAFSPLYKECSRAGDLQESCPQFEIPYFIFDGRLDQNTPAALVEDYFSAIVAPQKELHWFENAGHNPLADAPEKFKALLIEKLSAVTQTERAKGNAV